MKKLKIIIILFAIPFFLHAEKREITNGHRIWETDDCKRFVPLFSLTLERPDLATPLVKELSTQSIDTYNKFYLFSASGNYGFDYHFYLCNYSENTYTLLYTIKNKELTRDILSAYYSDGFIYSLEIPRESSDKYFITKRTIQSSEVIKEYTIDMFYFPKQSQHIWSMYVDEQNDRLFFIYSMYENNAQKLYLKLLYLTTGKEMFSSITDFRYIVVEGENVYLSKQNNLYTMNYRSDETFSLVKIENFVPDKEKIIYICKNDDIYVLTTEQEKYSFIMNFLFGTKSHISTNYACKFQDGRLVKLQKLKNPK